jgi:ParB/RepB/Spo0J family partition protein
MARDVHMHVGIDEIIVNAGRRELNETEVNKLARSIKEIGLRHPLTVREERGGSRYVLVAGRHRLEAMKRLGNEHVPVVIASMTNLDAEMWEISENLHRAELTKLERAEQIERWRELKAKKVAQLGPPNQPAEKGVRKTAEELGVTRQEVQRAEDIAHITKEAKEAIRDADLADNQSAMLKVAAEPPERQVAKVQELQALADRQNKHRMILNIDPLLPQWRLSFERLWHKASPADKQWAREFIDRPVMSDAFG